MKQLMPNFKTASACFVDRGFPVGHTGSRCDHWLLMKEISFDEDETISVLSLIQGTKRQE